MSTRHLRRRFDRRAAQFDAHAFAHRHAAAGLMDRLSPVALTPLNALDLGSGTGTLATALRERFRRCRVIELDHSVGMLRPRTDRLWRRRPKGVCADASRLPFRADVFDLIASNLCLPWLGEPDAAFVEANRTLRPGGVLVFSTLGPDSFRELTPLRSSLNLEPPPFLDMHDIGDALIRAGLTEPVLDVERTALEYGSAAEFLHELRATGSTAATPAFIGPRARRALEAALERIATGAPLRITLEIVYGHAFAGDFNEHQGKSAPVTIRPDQIGRRSR